MISIIAAIDEKGGIGKNNDLLFRIPEDFERMNRLTSGHPIIMGRATWESLPEKRRPLPERYSIVITRNEEYLINGAREGDNFAVVDSLEKGIEKARKSRGSEEIFLFGGGEIFKEALGKNLVDKLYLTIVKGDFCADTFFPDYSQFKKVVFKEKGKSKNYKYKFLELEK